MPGDDFAKGDVSDNVAEAAETVTTSDTLGSKGEISREFFDSLETSESPDGFDRHTGVDGEIPPEVFEPMEHSAAKVYSEDLTPRQGEIPGHIFAEGEKELEHTIEHWEKRLPEIENKIKEYAYDNNLDRYIDKDKLETPLAQKMNILDQEGMSKAYGDGYEDKICGFNNGRQSYINVETSDQYSTIVHEHLHQLSANDGFDEHGEMVSIRGISIDEKDIQINEGITDYYTREITGYADVNSDYFHNAQRVEELMNAMGEERFKESYFSNKPELLQQEFDRVTGEGKWSELSRVFDDSLLEEDYLKRQEAGRRADELIGEYVLLK